MAESFEILVRPYVTPAIRPGPPPSIVPKDDPAFGKAVLGGSSGQIIKLTVSEQSSWSRSRPVETKRVVDRERVKQKVKNPDGTEEINEENYVDIERLKKLTMRDGNGVETTERFADPLPFGRENIEVLEKDVTIINAKAPPAEGGGAAP